MKRLLKLFVILGVIGGAAAVAMRLLNNRRAADSSPFQPWTPSPPPMAEESLAPDEIVSVVDDPVSLEVAEEITGPLEPDTAPEEPATHHDRLLDFVPDDGSTPSTEEVEDGSALEVEVVEPETVPSAFAPSHQTPDEDLQLAENESGAETTEEVEHGAEMTVEVIEPTSPGLDAQLPDVTPPASLEGAFSEPSESVLEVQRGEALTAELLGADAPAPATLEAADASPEITPDDVLAAERDDGIPVSIEEVSEAQDDQAAEAARDDFLTRAFLELAATPDAEQAPSAAEPDPAAAPAPSVDEAHPPAVEAAPGARASEDDVPGASSADWVPAEEKAFEPLSTGVDSADLALADTLEEAIGGLSPGAITPRPARNAESFLDEGNVYFNVGQYALAIERYTRAIELDDTLTAAHYNRANARTRAGEFDGALADYDHALILAPNDADALNNRGMLHLYRQNYPGALRDFNAALAEDPADTTVMVNRGLAHLHGGDPIRAVEDFREASTLDPGDAAAHYGSSQASAALGHRDDALRSIERALAIDPGYAREAAADPRLAILQGDEHFMRLLRESGSRTS